MRSTGVLVLDDLGKEKAAEAVSTALYSVIEERTARERPILFTANYTSEELAGRFGEHGAYLVRRLREFCEVVVI